MNMHTIEVSYDGEWVNSNRGDHLDFQKQRKEKNQKLYSNELVDKLSFHTERIQYKTSKICTVCSAKNLRYLTQVDGTID